MNARGISVFYGSTDVNVAAGEVRPPVGSRVALVRFELLRKVRLLDVAALRSVYVEGSIFDPEFIERLRLAKFLERLSNRFATPVMPGDDPLDYLPTQVIADYLATRTVDPPLDGILYPSVQADKERANIVLFHKSSRVEAIKMPEDIEINVHSGHHTDEGWEEEWSVWEKVPEKESESKEPATDLLSIGEALPTSLTWDGDIREPTLRLDVSSI
jgi:hypothetical protein